MAPMTSETPGRLDRIQAQSVRLTQIAALLGLAGLLAISLITIGDILMRWLFSAPIAGVYDLSTLFIAVVLSACFPAALARRRHISVEFAARRLGGRANRVFDLIAGLLTLAFFVLLFWQLVVYSGELSRSGETTYILELPIAPWWVASTVIFALCALVQLLVVLLDMRALVTGRPAPDASAPDGPGSGGGF
jgi:TRAP-type C4-dicarboxylate transport system permease small subunit